MPEIKSLILTLGGEVGRTGRAYTLSNIAGNIALVILTPLNLD
jgi:hypothetical protein